jgi:hypothetical protein
LQFHPQCLGGGRHRFEYVTIRCVLNRGGCRKQTNAKVLGIDAHRVSIREIFAFVGNLPRADTEQAAVRFGGRHREIMRNVRIASEQFGDPADADEIPEE